MVETCVRFESTFKQARSLEIGGRVKKEDRAACGNAGIACNGWLQCVTISA